MDDVYGGEAVIKAVYEAIRNSPLWPTSMLVVTYDEHGGFYDSVPPVAAPAPADWSGTTYKGSGFTFDRLGVHVPALVVAPLIPAGVVNHTVYEHSTVPKTVAGFFSLPPLTARDRAANDLAHLLTLDTPRIDCPVTLPPRVASAARPVSEARLDAEYQAIHTRGQARAFIGKVAAEVERVKASTP